MNRQPVMVRNAQVQPLSVLGTEVRFLCEAHATGGAWSLMEVVLTRDSGPPLHEHDWDEGYYITEGEIEFTVGARSVLAVPGDFLYTPAGMPHAFRGVAGLSRVLILDVPAHAGKFFKEVDREVTELPRQLPKVVEIGARNGIRFASAPPRSALASRPSPVVSEAAPGSASGPPEGRQPLPVARGSFSRATA